MKVVYAIDLIEYIFPNDVDVDKESQTESYLCYESKKVPPVLIPGMAIHLPGFNRDTRIPIWDDQYSIYWFEDQEKIVIELNAENLADSNNNFGKSTWNSLFQNGWKIKNLPLIDL